MHEQSTFKGNPCFVAFTLQDIVNLIEQFPCGPWYRGEPKEYDSPCQPSINRRNYTQTPSGKGSLLKEEIDSIRRCQEDFYKGLIVDELFSNIYSLNKNEIDLNTSDLLYWASLAQHHNNDQTYPTRLLDITSDVFVAAFFACESKENKDENGYIFYGKPSSNNLLDCGKVTIDGSFFDIIKIEDINYPNDPYKPLEDTLCLAPLPFHNLRMSAQRGALIWSRDFKNGYFKQMGQGLTIQIPSACKDSILLALNKFGYNKDTLFPSNLLIQSSIILK